jgi:Rod binding domain-containing protein
MSLEGISGASLPVVDQAAMPAEVRNGTDKQKQAYAAALGFERMLVQQLTKSLAQDATGAQGSADSETADSGQDGGTDAGASVYGDMISSSLADSIEQQGGLGLANELYRTLATEGK